MLSFECYLPIADLNVNLPILISISLFTGILAGLFGMGGGTILVPLLIFIGIPTQTAIANATNQMTASSFSGYLAYAGRNRVDYKLGGLMLIGGLIGAVLGMELFSYLTYRGHIHIFVSISFLCLLSAFLLLSLRDLSTQLFKMKPSRKKAGTLYLPWQLNFPSTKRTVSIFSPVLTGLGSGIFVVVMGTSGSLFIIPTMLYLLRMSPGYTAGTTHFQMIFTTIAATILHAISFNNVDILLSVILICGAVLGTQIGVWAAARMNNDALKILLFIVVFLIFSRMLLSLTSTPESVYEVELLN